MAGRRSGAVVAVGIDPSLRAAVGRQRMGSRLSERVVGPVLDTPARAVIRMDSVTATIVRMARRVAPAVGVNPDEIGASEARSIGERLGAGGLISAKRSGQADHPAK